MTAAAYAVGDYDAEALAGIDTYGFDYAPGNKKKVCVDESGAEVELWAADGSFTVHPDLMGEDGYYTRFYELANLNVANGYLVQVSGDGTGEPERLDGSGVHADFGYNNAYSGAKTGGSSLPMLPGGRVGRAGVNYGKVTFVNPIGRDLSKQLRVHHSDTSTYAGTGMMDSSEG